MSDDDRVDEFMAAKYIWDLSLRISSLPRTLPRFIDILLACHSHQCPCFFGHSFTDPQCDKVVWGYAYYNTDTKQQMKFYPVNIFSLKELCVLTIKAQRTKIK
jgi:hypothetical protein